jgi:hypothetical protein
LEEGLIPERAALGRDNLVTGILVGVILDISFAAILWAGIAAAQTVPSQRVAFKPGTSSLVLQGNLDGQKSDRDYIINAKAGQTLDVVLTTSSSSVYFNVLPPGSPTALVNPSVTGQSSWTGTLPTDGDYTVRVYMMRSASRKGYKASYTLKIEIPPAVSGVASAAAGGGPQLAGTV